LSAGAANAGGNFLIASFAIAFFNFQFHSPASTFNSGPGGASGSSANAATQNFNAGGLGGGISGSCKL